MGRWSSWLWLCLFGACSGPGRPFPQGGTTIDAGPTTLKYLHTFVVDQLYLGDTIPNSGTTNNVAWTQIGRDLDGITTTSYATNVCTLAPGASPSVQIDGPNGQDNSFGANVLPLLETALFLPKPSATVTGFIHLGLFTLQIRIVGLDVGLRTPQSNTGLHGGTIASQLFVAEAGLEMFPPLPTFTTLDEWPVRRDLLLDPTSLEAGPRETFSDATILNSTLTMDQTQLTLGLVFSTSDGGAYGAFDLPIRHARVEMDVSGDFISNATIAGVIDPEALIASLRPFAMGTVPGLCGAAFDATADKIRASVDILDDATNRPGVRCNAISVGIGFTAKRISNPTIISDPLPGFDGCAPVVEAGLEAGEGGEGGSEAGDASGD